MTPTAVVLRQDAAVSIDVDIAPLPVVLPPAPTGGGPASAGEPAQQWLAVTGAEPAWLLMGAAVIVFALGIAFLRARHRRG